MQCICSAKRRCSLTILDNFLTVGKFIRGKEQANWPHPHPGGLLERAGGRCEKSHTCTLCRGAPAVIRALQEVREDRLRPY
jgi:hypothetical protein